MDILIKSGPRQQDFWFFNQIYSQHDAYWFVIMYVPYMYFNV